MYINKCLSVILCRAQDEGTNWNHIFCKIQLPKKKQEEQCAVQSVVRCRSIVILCSIAVVHFFIYCFTKIEACKRDNTYRITALLAN